MVSSSSSAAFFAFDPASRPITTRSVFLARQRGRDFDPTLLNAVKTAHEIADSAKGLTKIINKANGGAGKPSTGSNKPSNKADGTSKSATKRARAKKKQEQAIKEAVEAALADRSKAGTKAGTPANNKSSQ